MINLNFTITTNIKDVPGYPTIIEVTSEAVANHVSNILKDIKDPKTGEGASIKIKKHPEGVTLSLHGPDSVCDKVAARVMVSE